MKWIILVAVLLLGLGAMADALLSSDVAMDKKQISMKAAESTLAKPEKPVTPTKPKQITVQCLKHPEERVVDVTISAAQIHVKQMDLLITVKERETLDGTTRSWYDDGTKTMHWSRFLNIYIKGSNRNMIGCNLKDKSTG